MSSDTSRVLDVPDDLGGARLDVALAALVPGWSRSRLQRAIKGGAVRVDGETVLRPNTAVDAGARVEITLVEEVEVSTDVEGRAIAELDVLYEDDAIAVIDKPAGLVTHSNPRQRSGTVADLAVKRYGDLPRVQGEDRPGIVHRLDRLTSGVMVLGRTRAALEALKAQFQARSVEKTYLAVVHGTPRFDTEWLTGAIRPSPKNPERMRVISGPEAEELVEEGEARSAETFIERLEDFGCATLVAAHPKTGRTHQIRVHLQSAGIPIVGDRLYGPRGAVATPLPPDAPKLERPALHARRIAFEHPVSGERVTFEAPVPADVEALLDALRR
ncbi:MAG: RluA family pseudouridine synthase [Planctomycetota bacterium]